MSALPQFDFPRFHALLRTKSVGRPIVYRPVVGSTMDLARREAEEGAIHGTAVLAEEQTAGRGRRGRSFFSPPGANIYVTFLLRCTVDVHRSLPVRIPVAVAAAVRSIVPAAIIKWPNDIWVGRRKVCGMLIDGEFGASGPVAFPGIGINVNFDPSVQPELRDIATSLAAVVGQPVDREGLLARLCNELEHWLDEPFDLAIQHYREWNGFLDTDVLVSPVGGEPFTARAIDIDNTGGLVVRQTNGTTETVTAADVTIRPAET